MSSTPTQPPTEVQPVETPKKSKKIWLIIIIVLLLVCCVCMVGIGGAVYYFYQNGGADMLEEFDPNLLLEENIPHTYSEPQEASPQTSTESEAESEEEPLVESPQSHEIKLGDDVTFENCGVSFKKVSDFKYIEYGIEGESCDIAMVNGEEKSYDPRIMLDAKTGESALSAYDETQKMLQNSEENHIIAQTNVKINGIDAICFDQKADIGDITLKTREIFVMVTPTQFFSISTSATDERFDEILPYFEAVVNSVSFSEPQPLQK